MRIHHFLLLLILGVTLAGTAGATAEQPATSVVGVTNRVSTTDDATQSDGNSYNAAISADGRFVAYDSRAGNLVPGDTNGHPDIFIHDRTTGQAARVSVASNGLQANGGSSLPGISADGRYVAFYSWASNLVPGDTNQEGDVFVHDRATGETTRVSVASDGTQGNDWSGYYYAPSISADGRYIAFWSRASNLVPGDTNRHADVFVHDGTTGETSRISVASDGTQANLDSWDPDISGNGRYVAFISAASNLVPGDTNARRDIFVHDQTTGETIRVSVATDGIQANGSSQLPSISADGRYVAFVADATNLVPGDANNHADVFVHDQMKRETTRVSVASGGAQTNGFSWGPDISDDGRYVAFFAEATNLVPDDTNDAYDVFIRDRTTGETTRVSVASDGTQGSSSSDRPSISGDGRHVAFESLATNLVPGDTNHASDIFARDRVGSYGIVLSGDTVQIGMPGSTVTHSIVLSNTGTLTDTYDLGLSGGAWPAGFDGPTSMTLAPGATSASTVSVSIPASTGGASDVVTLTATSRGNPIVSGTANLTTTSAYFKFYLPVAHKH